MNKETVLTRIFETPDEKQYPVKSEANRNSNVSSRYSIHDRKRHLTYTALQGIEHNSKIHSLERRLKFYMNRVKYLESENIALKKTKAKDARKPVRASSR